jgi:hypothetical protein
MKLMGMKINRTRLVGMLFGALLLLAPNVARAANEAEVRSTVQQVFQQLKSHDYNSLYDWLPSSSRTRMSRERFANSLKRAQDMYALDSMDVGQVRVSKDMAVVDTVLYGRVLAPIRAEGKIVVQQYLVREEGKWRVATGDSATINRFLASNPSFRSRFPIRQPRIYVKQGNSWVEFAPPRKK